VKKSKNERPKIHTKFFFGRVSIIADKGNGGQPACPEKWKKCKEEHE
jgi:hypothetical protein